MNDKFDYVYDMGSGHWFRREPKQKRWTIGRIAVAALGFFALFVSLYALIVMLFCL